MPKQTPAASPNSQGGGKGLDKALESIPADYGLRRASYPKTGRRPLSWAEMEAHLSRHAPAVRKSKGVKRDWKKKQWNGPVAALCDKLDVTQEAMALLLGVSETMVGRYVKTGTYPRYEQSFEAFKTWCEKMRVPWE